MIIGIIGYGAVGISLYNELYDTYKDNVYFICDEKRISKYKEKPLIVNDKELEVKFESELKCDLLVIAVKCNNLEDIIPLIKENIKEDGLVLPLLNGIRSHDILQKKIDNNVLYGTINVISNKIEDKVICEKIINLQYGEEYNKMINKKLLIIKNIFDKANIANNIYEDMKRRIWLKWMLNMGINQLSSLLNINYIEMNEEHNLHILRKIFEEVLVVAKAYNINLEYSDVEDMITLCKNSFNTTKVTSLTLDINKGNIGELDEFSTHLLDLAKKKNLDLPYNYCFNQLLKGKVSNYRKNINSNN